MLNDIYVELQALERLRGSPAGGYLDDFTDWLATRRYTKLTIRSYVIAAVRFMDWAQETQGDKLVVDEHQVHDYRRHLDATATSRNRNGERGNYYCGARRFLAFLQDAGAVEHQVPTGSALVEAFCVWLRRHRGISDATLNQYRPVVIKLVEALGSETTDYTAGKLRSFVLQQVKGYSHSRTETIVISVRMFTRFLIATEQCAEGLEHVIPRVAGWRASSLPKYLPATDIERTIAACDPSRPIGARDRAIILLLARLALRAGDVAELKCSDIDWDEARIRLTGKNRRENWLPLPQDVGDAILHYLEHGRPTVACDRLFIISTAPYTPIRPRQVSQTAQRALLCAGVETPSYGAHIFRHSAATTMLRNGASLDEIGALLRHNDADTTALYAKVDVDLLGQVALPWPEEVAPC